MEKRRTLAQELKRSIKMKIAEEILVEEKLEDLQEERFRLSKCMGNEELGIKECGWYDSLRDECKYCGCIIETKAKTKTHRDGDLGTFKERALGGKIVITHCPMGRWADKVTANIYRAMKGEELLN